MICLLATVLSLSSLAIFHVSVSASRESASQESGAYNYDMDFYYVNGKFQKKLARKVEYVGGGKWDHKLILGINASSYYHKTKRYSTTVKSWWRTDSQTVNKGKTAQAMVKESLFGNKAWWNTY